MNDSPADIAHRLTPPLRNAPADSAAWPAAEWQALVEAGVTGWTIPAEFDGGGHTHTEILDGCRQLARANLSLTFILSQFQAACQRIVACGRTAVQSRWLSRLARGEAFATVGISHLTTSRQHIAAPAVTATETNRGILFDGGIPWVTGAEIADVLVIGGTDPDGRQILAAVPRDRDGMAIDPPVPLLALNNSRTASIRLTQVLVKPDDILAGPTAHVLSTLGRKEGGAGSLTTSALAVGHAEHALDRLTDEAAFRPTLHPMVAALETEAADIGNDLRSVAEGRAAAEVTSEALRTRATSLALRAAQAYLAAAKGAGFVAGHPAERLVREAMFFLVWSCPQAVANQLLSEFSRCDDV